MKKYKQKINKRLMSDSGATFTIEFIFIFGIIFFLFLAMVDLGMYFNTRSLITNITQDTARTVAIHGGDDTPITRTKYNNEKPSRQLKDNLSASFGNGGGVITIKESKCTPMQVSKLGSKTVSCTVDWDYRSLAPGLFRMTPKENTVTMYSESEVWW